MLKFKKKKLSHLSIAMVVSLFVLAACGENNQSESKTSDSPLETALESAEANGHDELIVGFPGNPAETDPHKANDVPSRQISSHIFETLVVMDEDQNLLPGLATAWESLSDNVWQFTIREGVTFHNGDPLTAHDVAFSIKRVAASSVLSPIFGMFDPELIEVIDTYTVNIGTTEPFAPALTHLAHHSAAILSENAIGETSINDTTADQLVGTGPYIMTELSFDDYIILERYDDFHGDIPPIRRIEFRIIPDPHARTIALETGEVNVILNISPSDVANLIAHPDIHVHSSPSHSIEFMGMNFDHPYLGIREVRQAINYALQTDTIVEVSTEGTSEPLATYLAPSAVGFSPDVPSYDFNLERAQALMDEAGVEGFDMTIVVNSGSAVRSAAAEMIQNQLQAIGINAKIQQLEWATYLEVRSEYNYDAYIGGWSNPSGDADNGLVSLFLTGMGDVQINSAELDDLLMEGRYTVDEEARLEVYHDVLQYLHEEAPYVLLGNSVHYVATEDNVRGITVDPSNIQFYGDGYFVD